MKTFVTPEMAQEWLGENRINRNLSTETYRAYANDMVAGRWLYTPNNGIMFGKTTGLLDGQHRLKAIVEAANVDPNFKGVEMAVYRDVDDGVRPVIDVGRVRSLGDVLTMEGHPYGGLAGATARLVINWLEKEKMGTRHTKPELHEFVLDHQDLFDYAGLARAAGPAGRPSALAAVMFLGTRAKDSTGQPALLEHAQRFAAGVADGANLHTSDARLALRDALWRQRGGTRGGAQIGWAVAATAHAWNAYVAQRPAQRITVQQDQSGGWSIPDIIGAPEQGVGIKRLNDATIAKSITEIIREMRASERNGEAAEARAS